MTEHCVWTSNSRQSAKWSGYCIEARKATKELGGPKEPKELRGPEEPKKLRGPKGAWGSQGTKGA